MNNGLPLRQNLVTYVLLCSTMYPIMADPPSFAAGCHLIVTIISGSSVDKPGNKYGLPGACGHSVRKKVVIYLTEFSNAREIICIISSKIILYASIIVENILAHDTKLIRD